ncbi:methyltransferase domain-containing protein [Candidatus Woesearchaeota archaeon]|nr:methyltransferase domain-containing protein [Candidatus Woesearchaeota archaeon]
MVYEPREDSFLILKEIKNFATGNVLDMGTGSGILAIEAAKTAEIVIGADISEDALNYAKQTLKMKGLRNIKFVKSDLFSYFKKNPMKFDLIIFNPPYLPKDIREPFESTTETTGGEKGYELLEKFFSQVSDYLMPDGKVLVLFSSLTGKDKVHSIMEEYGFNFQKLSEEPLFGEVLLVYIAEKSELLREMEQDGFTDVKRFAKGHRGVIFIGKFSGKKVAVKKQREDIDVTTSVMNEARWLKLLNTKGIGPEFLFSDGDYFAYSFVEGEFIPEFLEKAGKQRIKKVINDVFKQCLVLDKMKVNKEEMHNPYKHIIVGKKTVLIDFERTHASEKPKNVTQFCQFVSSKKVMQILKRKGFSFNKGDVNAAAQRYKKDMSKENFEKIILLLK